MLRGANERESERERTRERASECAAVVSGAFFQVPCIAFYHRVGASLLKQKCCRPDEHSVRMLACSSPRSDGFSVGLASAHVVLQREPQNARAARRPKRKVPLLVYNIKHGA